MWPKGRILEIWDKRKIFAAMFLEETAGGSRIRYLSPRGREENCAVGRVAHDTEHDLDASLAREQVRDRLRAWEEAAQERAAALNLETLWEVVREEGDDERELGELAQLALDSPEGAERSALLRALLDDTLHFQKSGSGWTPRNREGVEQEKQRREASARRAARMQEFRDALAGAHAGQRPGPGFHESFADVLEAMEGIVLGGPPHDEAGFAQSVLPVSGRAPVSEQRREAFRALVALGVFQEDEDLGRRRIRIPDVFPADVEQCAQAAASRGPEPCEREDLTELELWAIDDDDTRDIDDAVGFTGPPDEEGTREVVIAVADPAAFVTVDDAVDREALQRAVTHYLPTGILPMLPGSLAHGAGSLAHQEERPALVFFCSVGKSGELADFRAALATIRNVRKISYREVTDRIENGDAPFADLFHVSWTRVRLRHRAGAVIMRQPESDIIVRDGQIDLVVSDPAAPSRVLVSELMILAGEGAARWLQAEEVPGIYRRQPPPDNLPSAAGDPDMLDAPYDPVLLRAIRRRMRPSEVGVEPGSHAGLGLDAYSQVTSPLRRYQDLAVHRQIRARLLGEALPYDTTTIQRIAATTETAERELRAAERESREYWLLRHLEEHVGTEVEAIIVETGRRRTLIELVPYLYTASITARPTHSPGEKIEVRLVAVDARDGRLTLEERG